MLKCEQLSGASDVTVLMVVGAGRGPLVRASLAAADAAGRPLRVYAVEKNANAVVTLQNLVQSEGCAALGTAPTSQMQTCSLCVSTRFLSCQHVGACFTRHDWGTERRHCARHRWSWQANPGQ